MTRSEKLSPALEILEFKLNKEYSVLANLMQKKIENENKLMDLKNYQNSYSLKKHNQTITSIELHHKLMKKLQQAIDIQQDLVNDLTQSVNEKIDFLKKNKAQTKALEALIGRYRQQENLASTRKEQKDLDSQILAMLQAE